MPATRSSDTSAPAEAEDLVVLLVDDNLINRKKLSLAVQSLGHVAAVAEDGARALEALRTTPHDAVLLDIVMPEVDGFDVLSALKADERLRDIPVIVVSALDDETESVVRAIELGAEDFLPKDFDPILLKARLGASLTKKRFRDQELEHFRRVERLAEAAEVLESGQFSPQSLDLDALAARDDPLGRLAAVFRGMAAEIYARELRLKRTVQLLQGSFLVIAVGLVWGLTPALSRLSSGIGSNPLGLAVRVNGIAAALCFAVEAIVLAGRRPVHVDIFAAVGLMMALSALMLAPVAYATGELMTLGTGTGKLAMLVLLMGVIGAASLLLAFHLIATAGAVFYSQSA